MASVNPSMLESFSGYFKERMLITHFFHVILPFAALFSFGFWLLGDPMPLPHVLICSVGGSIGVLTGLGITVGHHRLFAHRSFQTHGPIKVFLAILGCMAGESFFHWVAWHRQHHEFSDTDADPHSPHAAGGRGSRIGRALHAHCGWFFWVRPDYDRYIPDLLKDRRLVFVERTKDLWFLLGLAIPTAAVGVYTRSWEGALWGFALGGLVRAFIVQHITFSVNSICHLFGSQPFRTEDTSRNNALIGVLALGEGWHNNHHAFPRSARQGLFWWQLDVSYWVIWLLERLRLAWNVDRPSAQAIERKRTHAA